jgi:outer membrane murein-binding lipoprotein Lpp
MQIIRIGVWILVFCAVVATGVEAYRGKNSSEPAAVGAQDALGLDRRISSLEQRLYSMESSISRLQQEAIGTRSSIQSQPGNNLELDKLRSEVEMLNARVRELECGVAHLDERTLSAAAKEARGRAGAQSKDPCRLSPETPVRLSSRP